MNKFIIFTGYSRSTSAHLFSNKSPAKGRAELYCREPNMCESSNSKPSINFEIYIPVTHKIFAWGHKTQG